MSSTNVSRTTLSDSGRTKVKKGRRGNCKDFVYEIELAVGMKVMVTTNLETDLDITNGARGEIVEIILHLQFLPICLLVKLDKTRATKLAGLQDCVIPIEPEAATAKYVVNVVNGNGKTTRRAMERRQFPITAAYGFTDYRSQGQIMTVFVDIATPPTGCLSLFNLYVALSRSSGRDSIRLLRDFDDEIFLQKHDAILLKEDDRLAEKDTETRE